MMQEENLLNYINQTIWCLFWRGVCWNGWWNHTCTCQSIRIRVHCQNTGFI